VECLIVGCGIVGGVIARELADHGFRVALWERRQHIAGNLYDYRDSHGVLVHKYGPHTFHTDDESLHRFIQRFAKWVPYRLCCGAVIDGVETPTPFNFRTIDQFFPQQHAETLKARLKELFSGRATVTVLEALECDDRLVKEYAQWLFEKDYGPYTAKQWGVPYQEIDPSVLRRVPLRLSYDEGYFDDACQVMPQTSYTAFFETLLDHPLITTELGVDACSRIRIDECARMMIDDERFEHPLVYTGALDELFAYCAGALPYRSLRFEWHHEESDSYQSYPVVAYPAAEGYTRITEYRKLPIQEVSGTTVALEYPLRYAAGSGGEPYYPVLTKESSAQFERYHALAKKVDGLYPCGRLADFKYYNMDQALARALEVSKVILSRLRGQRK
jgi:UDP-galactopyranose mutase